MAGQSSGLQQIGLWLLLSEWNAFQDMELISTMLTTNDFFLIYCFSRCGIEVTKANEFDQLPNLFISHLVLNLRIFSKPGNTAISQRTKTSVSSLSFASSQMLGNIGAPLDGTSFADNEDEEEENGAEIEMEAIEEHSEANEN
ncbi:hypothetical protein F5051DRAFT_434017 [Lentinula edodes]|nr:hypothetical protein F5051DRAFT_434017 [Lentinula edodes]